MLNIILLIISPALFSVRTDVLLCFIEFLSSFCWFPFALRVSLIPPSEISCNLFQWLRHAESLTKLSWNFWYPSQNFHGSFFSGSGAQSLWTSFCGKPEGPLRICMEAILLAQAQSLWTSFHGFSDIHLRIFMKGFSVAQVCRVWTSFYEKPEVLLRIAVEDISATQVCRVSVLGSMGFVRSRFWNIMEATKLVTQSCTVSKASFHAISWDKIRQTQRIQGGRWIEGNKRHIRAQYQFCEQRLQGR